MGKDERGSVSRIKIENLPKNLPSQAKVGPLGIVSVESLPNEDAKEVSIGPWISFRVPDAQAMWLE